MAMEMSEFARCVEELASADTDVKRLATQRLYVLMTGVAAPDEATAAAAVKAQGAAIDAAL